MDRKIVEYLVAGKSRRWIKCHLKIGGGRFEKVSALARQHGYLDDEPLPRYPQALFPDRLARRAEAHSDVDALLPGHQAWIEERLQAGWHSVTVPVTVKRSSFYRFLTRHGLAHLARDAGGLRVVPEIVHYPGEALILDWGNFAPCARVRGRWCCGCWSQCSASRAI